jgi:hypothetical protein
MRQAFMRKISERGAEEADRRNGCRHSVALMAT